MPPITPAVAARRLDALRACAANPQGLRGGAFPSAMPILEAEGLVARKPNGRSGRELYWFLTAKGRRIIAEVGIDAVGRPKS